MRIKMKKIIFVISLFISCVSSFSQGTENPLVKQIQHIKQEQGDSIARCYLDTKKDSLEQKGEYGSYLLLWGLLSSNMWQNNPTESLKTEYRSYLDAVIDDEIKSKEYTPTYELLLSLWQLTYDYYNMLYREGDKETTLLLLYNIHRWFKPYPEMRNSVRYAKSLLDLCLLLVRDMHKYDEGQPLAEEYLDVSKKVYGEKSAQYAVAIYNMHVFPSKSIQDKAEIIKRAISIYENAVYQDPAMLEEMKSTYNAQMVALTGKTNTENIEVSDKKRLSLSDCMALVAAGRGSEVIESLLYYKKMYTEAQYLDTLQYANVITLIIGAYIDINDLSAAQKEIDDFQLKIGIDNLSPEYASIFYSSAGIVAMQLKDYPQALRYAHLACRTYEKSSLPPIEYAKILGNISMMYASAAANINKDFYLDAKWYIDEAISVFEEKIGPLEKQGGAGLNLLNTKVLVYGEIGDREGSIDTYEKIVADFANNKDVENVWVLAANNLSTLYMRNGNPEKAIELLESLISTNREYNTYFKANLALAYYMTGDYRLKKTLEDYNNICYSNCLDVFNFFTEAERESFWTQSARELLVLNNIIAEKYKAITEVAYDNLLFVKNLKLMSSDILKKMVENSSDLNLKLRYENVLTLRNAISYRSNEQDSITIWKNQLKEEERAILSMVPDYKEKLLHAFHSWNEIKRVLKDDEIAVDFTYTPQIKDWDHLEGYYGAFVITNKSETPELVTLCNVDTLNELFMGKTADALQISTLYKESMPIYNSLWGKLEKYIKGKMKIYFSPTGPLNLLNHEALVMPNGELMGNHYKMIRLSSTDKILTNEIKPSESQQYQSAVVYGGIQYDLSIADMNEAAKQYKHSNDDHSLLAVRSEDERGRWNYLPGTKMESQNVYNILNSGNVTTTLLQNATANEESFKALSGHSPNIIHLSTHGFFLDTSEKVKTNPFMSKVGNYSDKEDKLIRTGVLMAGANNVWCGKAQVSGIEDGVLTADEISRLDLSGTDLVVLSACETAKGSVDPIDGVLGLQRGFKKAGAKSIMMSLWKVSDAVTSILMTEFYTQLGNGLNANEALKTATRKVKAQYPDPYYWAAFVMLD